jgi:hypothetical protein
MTQTDARAEGNGHQAKPITRADIEAKLGEVRDAAEAPADQAKQMGIAAGVAVLGVLVVIAFLLGRRRGRRRRGIIVIRQV